MNPNKAATALKMTNKKQTTKSKKNPRPYNRYNIYFILERERLILAKGGTTKWSSPSSSKDAMVPINEGYKNMELPHLPMRFVHLTVPDGWCVPCQQKRRPHRKTHGVASFRELARSIASSWKTIDEETLEFCTAVEKVSLLHVSMY